MTVGADSNANSSATMVVVEEKTPTRGGTSQAPQRQRP